MKPGLAALLAPLLLAAASDPFVGAWKLNAEKSTFEKGSQPPPPGITMTYSREGDGVTVTAIVPLPEISSMARRRRNLYHKPLRGPVRASAAISCAPSGRSSMEGSESTTLNRGGATGWVDTGDQEGVISPKVVLASLSMGDNPSTMDSRTGVIRPTVAAFSGTAAATLAARAS